MVVELMEAPTRTDEELIAQGRTLMQQRDKAMFKLGLLALEFAPMGEVGRKTGALERLQLFAKEIDGDPSTIRRYRTVAHAWQGLDVDGLSYSTLWGLLPVADKEGLLEAMAEVGPPQDSRLGRWTMQTAIQFARDHGFWTERHNTHALTQLLGALRRAIKRVALIPELDLTDHEREALREELRFLALEVATAREAVRE